MKSTDLYQKLNIPNFKEIQQEALAFFEKNPDIIRKDSTEDYFIHVPFNEFPLLKKFLESRAKIEINETSVNFIPANSRSKIHIDGLKKDNGKVPDGMIIAHQYVLILPILNYEESVNSQIKNSLHNVLERISNFDKDSVN